MNQDHKIYTLVLRDIKFRGYYLRFKEDYVLKYVVYNELEDGSGYYILLNDELDLNLMIDGWYKSKDEFLNDIYEELVVDWKLYVKDKKPMTDNARRIGEHLKELIEPIETFEDEYDIDTFFQTIIAPPHDIIHKNYLDNINKAINNLGYEIKLKRLDLNKEEEEK